MRGFKYTEQSFLSAINGTVTVTFAEAVTEVPEGLVILKDGVALELEASSFVVSEGKVEVTVPQIEATAEEQSIVYSAKLGDAEAVAAEALVIPAADAVVTTIEVAAVSVEEFKTATPVVTVKDQFERAMTGVTVTYAVDNTTVATVATDGTVTGGAYVVDANTATLTITYTPEEGDAVTATAAVTVTEDTTLPTATLTVVDNKHIDVTFSEKVTGLGTITNNYSLVKSSDPVLPGGELLDGAGATAVVIDAGLKVRLRLEDGVTLAPAQYLFYINPVTAGNIADLAGNEVYEGTEIIFTPSSQVLTDVTAPILLTAAYDSSTRQLVLTFDENVTQASYDATKVTFDGVTLASADAAVVAANVATITLTQSKADALNLADGANVVLAEAFADAAGNKVSATKAVSIVTPPTLADAQATGSSFDEATRILTIKFNEAVTLENVALISLDNQANAAQALTVNNDVVVTGTNGTQTIQIQVSAASYANFGNVTDATTGLTIAAGAVKDLEGTANKAIAKVEIPYTQDTVAPEITGVTYNNQTNVLTITANELLAGLTAASWSIDTDPTTGAITLVAATDNNASATGGVAPVIANNTITATFDSVDSATVEGWYAAGKTIKIYTTNADAVTDLAGNQIGAIALADGTAVELVDQIAPDVDVAAVGTLSATKFSLKFNEVMNKASTETATNYVIYDNQNDKNIAVTTAALQADGVTVFLTTAETLAVPNVNNYSIIINNVKDVSLNRIGNNTVKPFTLGAVDAIAPVVASVTFTAVADKDNDTIAVAFTEAGSGLDKASAENLANYVVKDATSKVVSLTGATATLSGTTVTITLTNGYNLQTGANYTIDVSNVKDKADNVMTAYAGTATAAVGDSTAPTITGVVGRTTPTGDQVVITFSEAVQKTLAETIANYTVKTNGGDTTLDDADATALVYTETDANSDGVLETFKATITYAAGKLVTGVGVTSVAGIKDLAGNAMVAGNTTNGSLVDGVAPSIVSVTATTIANKSNDTIAIVFNEGIVEASAIVGGKPINVVVKDGNGTAISLAVATAAISKTTVDNDTLTITLAGATTQLTTGATYTVEINGIMDAAGNEVVETKSVVAAGDDTAPTFTVTTAVKTTKLVVITASEDLNSATVVKGDFVVETSIIGDFSDTVTYVIASIVDNADKTYDLNLTTDLPTPSDGNCKIRVKVVDTNGGVSDLAGNVQDDFTTTEVSIAQ